MSSQFLNSEKLSSLLTNIHILVPKGVEHQAVRQGLQARRTPSLCNITLDSIPAGSLALADYLATLATTWQTRPSAFLVMGVAGSLTETLPIGQAVLLDHCCSISPGSVQNWQSTDRHFTEFLQHRLRAPPTATLLPCVKGLTTPHVVTTAIAKQHLAQQSGAAVVEMENMTVLKFAQEHQIPIAMLRVVSDGVEHDLPDLSRVFDSVGNLKPFALARTFSQHPIAAGRLIRGSLIACGVLKQLAAQL